MSRPLTIGERQKLRTAEERRESSLKAGETRRKNRRAKETVRAFEEGYSKGFVAGRRCREAAMIELQRLGQEIEAPPKARPSTANLLSEFFAKWWKR